MTEPHDQRFANAVWDVLVEHAGAREESRADFLANWPRCVEYRFMGTLGFGGKVWSQNGGFPHVTFYPEDRTPERVAVRDKTNMILDTLDVYPAQEEP